MKKNLLLFVLAASFLSLTAQDCSDLFFSEYLEGSGNNKGVEIFNPTDKIIDLSKYWVARYSNGSVTYTAGGLTQLEGFLQPYSTFSLVNGQTFTSDNPPSPACDPAMQALADMLDHAYPAPTYMNGNDAIALLKSEDKNIDNAVAVDLIGEIGLGALISDDYGWSDIKDTTVTYHVDTVTQTEGKVINYIVQGTDVSGLHYGPFWFAITKDQTLVRKPWVKQGVKENPHPFLVFSEWDSVGKNQWDSLNFHTCDCTPATYVIEQKSPAQAYVFPNPVKQGILTLYATHGISSYEILDITGQLLRKEYTASAPKTVPVAVHDMKRGVYLLRTRFTGSNHILTRKFLIQ